MVIVLRYQLKQFYSVKQIKKQLHMGNMPPRALVIDDSPDILGTLLSYLSQPQTLDDIRHYIKTNSNYTDKEISLLIDDLINNNIISTQPVDLNKRYSRHELYYDFIGVSYAANAQQILQGKKVGLIGVGGIGSNVAMILAGAGIGNLVLMDADTIEESNLTRQFLYDEDSIGSSKVDTAYKQLKKLNSSLHITTITDKLTKENLYDTFDQHLYDCDFIVLSADSPSQIHTWINNAALEYGFSYSNAGYIESIGIIGPLVVPYETACYECYKNPEENNPPKNLNKSYQTPSYGPLNSLVSSIQANEVIRHLLNIKTKTKGCRLSINSTDYSQSEERFTRKHDCKCGSTCKGGDKHA